MSPPVFLSHLEMCPQYIQKVHSSLLCNFKMSLFDPSCGFSCMCILTVVAVPKKWRTGIGIVLGNSIERGGLICSAPLTSAWKYFSLCNMRKSRRILYMNPLSYIELHMEKPISVCGCEGSMHTPLQCMQLHRSKKAWGYIVKYMFKYTFLHTLNRRKFKKWFMWFKINKNAQQSRF